MESLHRGHTGMSKMHLRAKQSLYWPGINDEIRNKVENCIPCQMVARSQQKEPAIPIEVPFRPLQKIGMDLFFCTGKWYLLVCDYYSKFPIFRLLPSISSNNVISALESIISEYANVEEIICDNGKQFMAQEYKNFPAQYGVRLTSSRPYHPKGHGFIERQVQTIKKILIKCELDGTSPHMAMLELSATPLDDNTPSLAALLGNRRYKTTLPAITRASYNSEAVWQSSKKAGICWAWCPCQGVTTAHTPAASMASEGPQHQPLATSHSDIHTRWEYSQVLCDVHPRWCQIPAKLVDVAKKNYICWEVESTSKGIWCEYRCIQSTGNQLSKSDSPQVYIPLSTNNNKGSSPKSLPKPTQNLVHAKEGWRRHWQGKTKKDYRKAYQV